MYCTVLPIELVLPLCGHTSIVGQQKKEGAPSIVTNGSSPKVEVNQRPCQGWHPSSDTGVASSTIIAVKVSICELVIPVSGSNGISQLCLGWVTTEITV